MYAEKEQLQEAVLALFCFSRRLITKPWRFMTSRDHRTFFNIFSIKLRRRCPKTRQLSVKNKYTTFTKEVSHVTCPLFRTEPKSHMNVLQPDTHIIFIVVIVVIIQTSKRRCWNVRSVILTWTRWEKHWSSISAIPTRKAMTWATKSLASSSLCVRAPRAERCVNGWTLTPSTCCDGSKPCPSREQRLTRTAEVQWILLPVCLLH